jgi:hypothetical protein
MSVPGEYRAETRGFVDWSIVCLFWLSPLRSSLVTTVSIRLH